MRIECPGCGVSGQVDPGRAAGLVRCPKCGARFVPQSETAAAGDDPGPPAPGRAREPVSGPRIGVGPLVDQDLGFAPAPARPRAAPPAGPRGERAPVSPATRAPEQSRHPFRAGDALGETFPVWVRNLVPFTLLTALLLSPIIILNGVRLFDVEPARSSAPEVKDLDLYLTLAMFFLGLVVSGTLVYGVFQQLRGRHASALESFAKGLGALVSIIGVGVLILLALGTALAAYFATSFAAAKLLGFVAIPVIIALVVPLCAVPCGLFVAVPAAVVERPGPFGAIRRSWELTRGYRFQIFLVVLVLLVLTFMGTGFAVALLATVAASAGATFFWGFFVLGAVSQVFTCSLLAVAAAVVYHDLKLAKEGIGIEELASVFD